MSRQQSHCFVPGCKSGYKSCKEKLSLFGVPKEEQVFQQWQRNIPRVDRPLERNAAVCVANIEEVALLRKIDNLPPKQKAAILQCFEAASRKSLKGMRYSSEWVLECVIMRIKSPRLYEHVGREKILMLPSHTCLRNFMKKYESSFGFNSSVLSGIAKKRTKWMSFSATAVP
ncbi:hypothetical protein HPB49_020203 [Dermacentor silvarum]|uniref:Uncharacterized protein n=1 Tax=Dermacentor silvarum TaxID=543639 RepID=A0ACB8C586_DERSI|nr:hypothetical protein HPB49_020203 [Dermacentor silvarum]